MKTLKKKIIRCLCLVIALMFIVVYAEDTNIVNTTKSIEYNVSYVVVTIDNVAVLNATFSVMNNEPENEEPLLIAALYNNGQMITMKMAQPSVNSGNTANENVSIVIPEENSEGCYIRLFAWEGTDTLRPLGEYKMVKDIDPYLREKIIYVTADENTIFNVYMSSLETKGENDEMIHTIEYNATELVPTDLCGFTHEKEQITGTIQNAGVVIESFDAENGIIKYKFLNDSGRNTGINNFIKFKALTSIADAEIKYIIQ